MGQGAGRRRGARIRDIGIVFALAVGLSLTATAMSNAEDGTTTTGAAALAQADQQAATTGGAEGAGAQEGAGADSGDASSAQEHSGGSPTPSAGGDPTSVSTPTQTPTAQETSGEVSPSANPLPTAASPTPGGTQHKLLAPAAATSPAPTTAAATTATITVTKGGIRTASAIIGPLAGATFSAYAADDDETPAGAAAASCTTDASGKCSMTVPARTSKGNSSGGYWVVETAAPVGYALLSQLTVQTNTSVAYRYHTGSLAAGATVTVPQSGSGIYTSAGIWADPLSNPALSGKCGLNIALLFDTSTSISSSEMSQMKTAAGNFITALTGTPTSVALYSFATTAPAGLATKPLRSVLDPATATQVISDINTLPSQGNGSTNWDRGLWQIAASSEHYDAVLMLTDGMPTVYGPSGAGSGSETRFVEIEHAIFSANALKSKSTRVIPVGIGVGSNAGANLAAISGPAAGSDYYTTNFAALSTQLAAIASETCGGTINVVKQVQQPNGDTVNAGGWTFTSATSGVSPGSGQTDSNGVLTFSASFGGKTSLPVTIAEEQQSGYTLVQQGGKNAVCTVGGEPVTVTNSGALGFTVSALANKAVSCVVMNKAPLPQAQVVVNKVWKIDGTTLEPNSAPPAGFSATLGLTGQQAAAFGTTYSGYTQGGSVVVSEQSSVPPYCALTSSGDLGQHTLAAGLNTFTITNTVTCTQVTLSKSVVNDNGGTAQATDFILTATPQSIAGQSPVSGPGGVTNVGVLAGTYQLSESAVPGYQATGPWICSVEGGGAKSVNGGKVTLAAGEHVTCSITNDDIAPKLKLTKILAGPASSAVITDWTLEARLGAAGTPTLSGPGGTNDYQPVQAGTYNLQEAGGLPWQQGAFVPGQWACYRQGESQPFSTGAAVTVALGDVVDCRITNTYTPGTLTLVKHVDNGNTGGSEPASSWTLTATPDAGVFATLSGPGSEVGTAHQVVGGQWYTLTESGTRPGYVNGTQWVCTGAAEQDGNRVKLAAGAQATCTITNTAQQSVLSLVKIIDHGTSGDTTTAGAFTLSAVGSSKTISAAAGSAAVSAVPVPAGTYQLSESGPAGFAASKWVCLPWIAGAPTGAQFNAATATSVTVGLGDNVVCYVRNTAIAPSIKLIKEVEPQGSADPSAWTVTATADGLPQIGGAGGTGGQFVDAKVGATYTIAESGGTDGFYQSSLVCTGASQWDAQSGTVTAHLGEQITCVVTNSAPDAAVTVDKAVDSGYPAQQADGTWDIRYTVTVTNTSAFRPVTYSLSDALRFGSGVSVNSASATGPGGPIAGWNGQATQQLDSGATLPAGGSAQYHVSANATVPAGAYDDEDSVTSCAPQGNSAFANEAIATVGDHTYHARACGEPAAPTVAKSNATAAQQADGSWSLSYTISVTNDSDVQESYDLADNPQALPAGVTQTAPATVASPDVTIPASPGWPGSGTIVTGVILPAHAVHTFVVTQHVMVSAQVTPVSVTCTAGLPGNGIINSAVLSSGQDEWSDTGCGEIDVPQVSISKYVTGTSQNTDGSWTITYRVAVSNSATAGAIYDLDDSPDFGAGITVTSASATGPGGAGDQSASWSATVSALARNRVLSAGASEEYTITVHAQVAAGAYSSQSSQLTCEQGEEGPQGAFTNRAWATAGGSSVHAAACSQPARPTFEKHAVGSPVKIGANTWQVSYDLVVSNPSDVEVSYTLDDHPILPGGASAQATATSSDVAVNPDWTGTPPHTRVVDPQVLPAGATHTVHVTTTILLAAGTNSQQLTCPADQGVGGAVNVGTITAGADTWDSSACVTLTNPAWTLSKTAVPAAGQVQPGSTVSYTLTAHNTSTVAAYNVVVNDDLADVLSSATLAAASVTPSVGLAVLSGDGHTLSWNIGTLAAGSTATLTYEVTVNPDAWDVVIRNAASGTGEVPPATCTTQAPCSVEHTTPAQPTLQLEKSVDNAWGGQGEPDDFTLTATPGDDVSDLQTTAPSGPGGVGPVAVYPGTYTLSESSDLSSGYDPSSWQCSTTGPDGDLQVAEGNTIAVEVGDTVYCRIVNSDKPARLTLVKQVDGQYAQASPASWTLTAHNEGDGTNVSGSGDVTAVGAVVNRQVPAGTYLLSEAPVPQFDPVGYTAGSWGCYASDDEGHEHNLASATGTVELANGANVTCVVINTAQNPQWTVTKSATTDSVLTAPLVEPGDTITYTLTAQHLGGIPVAGVDITDDLSGVLSAGTYNDDAVASVGTVVQSGDALHWHLDSLTGTQTLTYTVSVKPGSWNSTLTNAVTGSGPVPPEQCAAPDAESPRDAAAAQEVDPDCQTTHEVPQLPRISLVKEVNAQHGGVAIPANWTLSATPTGGVGNPPGGPVRGAGSVSPQAVLPGTYQLQEEPTSGDGPANPSQWVSGLWTCVTNEGEPVTLESGLVTLAFGQNVVCRVVNSDIGVDLKLTKTATVLNPDGTVESGQNINYALRLDNVGDTPATGTHATDEIPAYLKVVEPLPTVAGWALSLSGTDAGGYGGVLTFTQDPGATFDPGATQSVSFQALVGENLTEDATNSACVASNEADDNPDDNCDSVDTPTKRIDFASVAAQCVRDTAWVYFDFSTANVPNAGSLPVTATWRDLEGNVIRVDTLPAGTTSGRLLWPGVVLNADGEPIGYPGYRELTAADDPNDPGVFENLILDPSLPSYQWRNNLTITFEINPHATITVTYPPATAACVIPRDPGVQITKTASVASVSAGDPLSYTLSVTNTGLGAVRPVTLTDALPAALKVTSITTDPDAFPGWQNCHVEGASTSGYGGTLICHLNGTLGYADTAPDVVITAVTSASAPAGTLANTGTVCWTDPSNAAAGQSCTSAVANVTVMRGVMAPTGAAIGGLVGLIAILSTTGLALFVTSRRRKILA